MQQNGSNVKAQYGHAQAFLVSWVILYLKGSCSTLESVSDSIVPRQKLLEFSQCLKKQLYIVMLSRNKDEFCSLVQVKGHRRNIKSLFSLGHPIGCDALLQEYNHFTPRC